MVQTLEMRKLILRYNKWRYPIAHLASGNASGTCSVLDEMRSIWNDMIFPTGIPVSVSRSHDMHDPRWWSLADFLPEALHTGSSGRAVIAHARALPSYPSLSWPVSLTVSTGIVRNADDNSNNQQCLRAFCMPVNVYMFNPHPTRMVLLPCHFIEMEIEAPGSDRTHPRPDRGNGWARWRDRSVVTPQDFLDPLGTSTRIPVL